MKQTAITFEQNLMERSLTDRDCALLKYFYLDHDPELMAQVFEGLDFDNEPVFFRVLLASLCYTDRLRYVPESLHTRFTGIYHHFKEDNDAKLSWLSRILARFRNEGIPCMLIKGSAMYAYYRRDLPRIMDDYDLAVPEQNYEQACRLLAAADCTSTRTDPWSATFLADTGRKPVYIDLHKQVFKNAPLSDHLVWQSAVKVPVLDTEAYVPSPVHMCLLLFDTQIRNLFYIEHPERRLKWLVDWLSIKDQYPQELQLADLRTQSLLFYDTYHVQLALRIIAGRLPELLPMSAVDQIFPVSEGYTDWLERGSAFSEAYSAVYQLPADSPLTRKHLRLSRRRWISEYRFFGPELKAQYGHYSFLQYFFRQTGSGSLTGALKKYIPRLSLKQEDTHESR